MISACIITYNQKNFIAETIEGALSQKCLGEYEIVIGDDCSTDGTSEICSEFKKKYPDKIRLIRNNQNLGMIGNWINTLKSCKGKYIALCEGDDYWADPNKLQKQVDFLETNPEYSICHHAYKIFNEENQQFSDTVINHIPLQYDIGLLSKRNTIGTLTVMYRNQLSLPPWFSKLSHSDYPLHLLQASFGKIKYFPDEMAVYRRHHQSVTGSFTSVNGPLFLIKSLEVLVESLTADKVVNDNLGLQLLDSYMTVFNHYHFLNDDINANNYFVKIRSLKRLFNEGDLNKNILLQIYIYRIKKIAQLKDHKELISVISDFQDETIKYLLQAYAAEAGLNNNLYTSTSYKLGNKLVDTILPLLRFLKLKKR